MLKKVKFANRDKSEFFAVLKSRIDAYFTDNNLSRNANAEMIFKTVLLIGTYWACFGLIVSDFLPHSVMFGLALLMGFTGACIGFCVSHDAVHGSYSSNARVNQILAYSFEMLGANTYLWNIMHNVVHHTHTNIPGHDEDLEAGLIVRLSPEQPRRWFHRFQHIYAFFLYSFASLAWVFMKDFKKMAQKQIGSYIVDKPHPRNEYIKMYVAKAIYYGLFFIAPMFWIESLTWWQVLLGFLAMHVVEGLTLALVFQLAHVVEGAAFPIPDEQTSTLDDAWAIHQMRTTANFSRKSWFATFFFGGLNFQIEHHLFPKICHIHYAPLSDIVHDTANEFDIPYLESKTFASALASHYRVLRAFGRDQFEPAENQLAKAS